MVIVVSPFYICIQHGHLLQIPGAGYHRAKRSVAVLQLGLRKILRTFAEYIPHSHHPSSNVAQLLYACQF